jgi:hypothetical protein
MKCDSVREQLTAYLDGDLDDHRGSAVRGHLRGCEACRSVASDEAALRDGLRALPPLDPPASLWEGVQRQLAAAEIADAERPAWRRALSRLARLAPRPSHLGFAAAAIAAAILLLVVRAQDDDRAAPARPATTIGPVVIAPDHGGPEPEPAPMRPVGDEGDVSTELAAEPSRVTESYASTVRELLVVANEARAQWPAERQREFDAHVAALQKKAADAADDRPRRAVYRQLIRYIQRAVIRDDVALASIGGAP